MSQNYFRKIHASRVPRRPTLPTMDIPPLPEIIDIPALNQFIWVIILLHLLALAVWACCCVAEAARGDRIRLPKGATLQQVKKRA